jgi:hypothetical protein
VCALSMLLRLVTWIFILYIWKENTWQEQVCKLISLDGCFGMSAEWNGGVVRYVEGGAACVQASHKWPVGHCYKLCPIFNIQEQVAPASLVSSVPDTIAHHAIALISNVRNHIPE